MINGLDMAFAILVYLLKAVGFVLHPYNTNQLR
jgi:hypothetical protein